MVRRSKDLDPNAAVGHLFVLPDPRRPPPKFKNPTRPVWSENKARFIARYLQYFVFVTYHGTYIDGFAGPQKMRQPDLWTAKLVLESTPRWLQHFYLFDKRKDRYQALLRLKDTQPPRDKKKHEPQRTVEVVRGDFNVEVLKLLAARSIPLKEAVFCLLDQHTFECRWDTVRALAQYPKAEYKNEILYFLPSYWLNRALSGIKKEWIVER